MNLFKDKELNNILANIGFILLFYISFTVIFIENTIIRINPSILKSDFIFIKSLILSPSFLYQFLFILLFLLITFKKSKWENLENNKTIKIFIFIVSIAIFWEQSFHGYNFYLNGDFVFDKILLLLSALLILYHPIFVFVFVSISLLIWKSLIDPLGSFHWTEIKPVYELLILFLSFIIVRNYKDVNTNIFIFLAITFHASNYFIPGIAKIEISPNGYEWVFLDNIHNLFIMSFANGWLGFLDESIVIQIALMIDKVDILITIITLLIQVGALFLLYNKKITLWFFVLFELLHIGIFFASGIFFINWIIINLGFIYLIKNIPNEDLKLLFTKKLFILSIVIILLSPLIYKPIALAWFDTRLNTIYRVYALTDKNETIQINRNNFAPYDNIFTQNRFTYLDTEKVIPLTYGSLNRDNFRYSTLSKYIKIKINNSKLKFDNNSYELYEKIEDAKSRDEINEITLKNGKRYYSKKKYLKLKKFLNKFFLNYNKNYNKSKKFYHYLGSPYHIYDLSTKRLSGEKIKKVFIEKEIIWWNKKSKKIERFGNKIVLKVDIK